MCITCYFNTQKSIQIICTATAEPRIVGKIQKSFSTYFSQSISSYMIIIQRFGSIHCVLAETKMSYQMH